MSEYIRSNSREDGLRCSLGVRPVEVFTRCEKVMKQASGTSRALTLTSFAP
jgi:hypothetical protein